MVSTDPYVWWAALLTISMYSVYIKESNFGRWGEFTLVGFLGGHFVAIRWSMLRGYFIDALNGRYTLIIGIVFGLLLFSRWLLPLRHRWVERYPISTVFGARLGLTLTGVWTADIMSQIRDTLVPLNNPDPLKNVGIIIVFIGAVTIMASMAFSSFFGGNVGTGVSKVLNLIGKPGKYFILAGAGITFCNIYQGRIGQASGRIWFLLNDWLQLG
jgi:hypothetical protein